MAKSTVTATESLIEESSGNIFADLGRDDAQEKHLRVQLAARLNSLIDEENLTQTLVAKKLGIAQPHVSALKNYQLARFSSERLMHFITLFDRDVEIFIRPRSAASGRKKTFGSVSVWSAA